MFAQAIQHTITDSLDAALDNLATLKAVAAMSASGVPDETAQQIAQVTDQLRQCSQALRC